MAINATGIRQQAIHKLLVQRIGDPPTAAAVSAATIDLWNHVAAQLVPVIGLGGVHSLLHRSAHIIGKRTPWLVIVSGQKSYEAQLTSLRTGLEECNGEAGIEASCDLLVTFCSLLAGLIGERLIDQLLNPVLTAPSETEQEIAPHGK